MSDGKQAEAMGLIDEAKDILDRLKSSLDPAKIELEKKQAAASHAAAASLVERLKELEVFRIPRQK